MRRRNDREELLAWGRWLADRQPLIALGPFPELARQVEPPLEQAA